MAKKLSAKAQAYTKEIVEFINGPKITSGKIGMAYSQLDAETHGSAIGIPLGELGSFCNYHKYPPINYYVVDKTTRTPNDLAMHDPKSNATHVSTIIDKDGKIDIRKTQRAVESFDWSKVDWSIAYE